MNYSMMVTLSLLTLAASAGAEQIRVVGYIGSHKTALQAEAVTDIRRFPVQGSPDYIAITEVYPDLPDPVTYDYTVSANGVHPYHRTFRSLGFGRLTYFIKAGGVPVGDVRIAKRSSERPTRPLLIASVSGVSQSELDKLLKQDRFTIMGLLPWEKGKSREELAFSLVDKIEPRPEYGIDRGLSTEIRYAAGDTPRVQQEIADIAELARRFKVPALMGMVSWWSGTPRFIDDGAGGKFGDLKYQQICYAPDRKYPHNPELKKLLGERYNTHYRLSTPNQWSNTPWLTMNNKSLNGYRFRRLYEAVGLLKKAAGGDTRWIAGVFLENEPRYWDAQCEAPLGDLNPPRLWADFNPVVLADASSDGVELDPSDGLSNDELTWLHRNVGRYVQDTVDAYRNGASAHDFGAALPVYTHALQFPKMFPGAAIEHPGSEWAYAKGARSGIEGMFTMPSDFYRLREWGRWGDVNREENDGMSIDLHLWDLRVAYMMGSDLYNSYNWHAIGPERFFAYVKEFLDELPVVQSPPAKVVSMDGYALKMKTPMKLQAFTRIELPIRADKAFKGTAYVGLVLPDGRTMSSEYTPLDLVAGDHIVGFSFTTPAESGWRDDAQVVLYAFDGSGRMALDGIGLNPEAQAAIKLILDLRTQRALSLAAITRAEAVRKTS